MNTLIDTKKLAAFAYDQKFGSTAKRIADQLTNEGKRMTNELIEIRDALTKLSCDACGTELHLGNQGTNVGPSIDLTLLVAKIQLLIDLSNSNAANED
jgi:hypothetical protein